MAKKRETREERLKRFEDFDRKLNVDILCGIDEAGRGCMAGPIYSACVVLPKNICDIEGLDLNDSKKIAEKKRYKLADMIKEIALGWGIGSVSNETIDAIGIQKANFLAFQKALENMKESSGLNPDLVLIDGCYNNIPIPNHKTLKKGDTQSACIAAASILAKTSRDKYVIDICHKEYPDYNFEKHKGYGTKEHRDAIIEYGISKYHRKSFCKKYI